MNTEMLDPRYRDVEHWPTHAAVEAMLEGQMAAIAALYTQTAAIAAAADAAAARLEHGGRMVFVGAGTSGRLAVQDGTELHPTFGWPDERTAFLMAGGADALTRAREGAEDDADAAGREVAAARVGADDVMIGVAASGRTPFTVAAIAAARAAGALTIGIANNAATPLTEAAEHVVVAATGSEIIAGSTRMKAGTAQKAALNLLSTAIMIRLGLVHDGRMVAMRVSNAKLLRRARAMVQELTGIDADAAADALSRGDNDIRRAVLIARGLTPDDAAALLERHYGRLGAAIAASA
ncbi:N-acetylmuramic acid 6-phosphate etherase [Sphingomonas sp. 2R-10]|uniref:N-acetylmuramic acid 6-phosphate etherase n=1 Tax=Sphingomonas sp. 2R-10 TaxID=3045148 RepID=UPI000F799B30|nr:N-acetylmuramic acid 6-phosphate etherase [Sphingomonas sp. 2R-10]MDJ0277941.1 N-acetylmuramic acid 6-phosphate etherase [Sphingomonas sp. 2R-10]